MKNIKIEGTFWKDLKKVTGHDFKKKLVNEAGVRAVRFSKERFRQKNWVDKTVQPWKKRKQKNRGSLMARTGRLKRSIRVTNKGRYFVRIGTDVPYAKIHNEGGVMKENVRVKAHSRKRSKRQKRGQGRINVRAHNRRMNTKIPARQFIGSSHALAVKIEKKVKKLTDTTLKKIR